MVKTTTFIVNNSFKKYFRHQTLQTIFKRNISSKRKHSNFVIKNKENESFFKQINFDLLTIFYTIVTMGSISKAAEHLAMTQPSVSLYLNRIESEFGNILVKHTLKGVKLTVSGLLLFNYIQRLFQLIEEALKPATPISSMLFDNKIFRQKINHLNIRKSFFPRFKKIYSFYSSKRLLPIVKFSQVYNSLPKDFYLKNRNYSLFQTKSNLFVIQDKIFFPKKDRVIIIPQQNTNFLIFEITQHLSFNKVNKNLLSFNITSQLIEIQTSQALNTCLELNISELICWSGVTPCK